MGWMASWQERLRGQRHRGLPTASHRAAEGAGALVASDRPARVQRSR